MSDPNDMPAYYSTRMIDGLRALTKPQASNPLSSYIANMRQRFEADRRDRDEENHKSYLETCSLDDGLILEQLAKGGIFAVFQEGVGVVSIWEQCDQHYRAVLTSDQLRRLASELVSVADAVEKSV